MSLTSTQKKENNIVELEIAVGAEELKASVERVYRRKAKTITVPGFRKGKAPRALIEKMYGEGIFLEDAVSDLYPEAYGAAVEEAGIEPVNKADVEMLTLDKNTGFTFKATVTVKPEVMVKEYKGISAQKKVDVVEDADVEGEITRMRERNARIITVTDRPAREGDDTVIDFEGFVDGAAFEGGKAEKFELTLGSGSFIDTFEDQVAGHSVGDEFEVNVTFPEEYHVEDLKGKPALFKVKLHEIRGKELPELDDEFAKDVSEFDTVEELRADLRAKMQEARDARAKDDFENQLVDKVIEKLEGDIPECMYENKVDDLVHDFEHRLSSQGMNMKLYLQYTGMDEEGFRQTFRQQAERQVKIWLALEKIAELEGIECTPEDIEKEYARLAEEHGLKVDKIKGFLSEKDVAADFKTGKAIDLVRDSAVVVEVAEEKAAEEKEKSAPPKKKTAARKAASKKNEAEAGGE